MQQLHRERFSLARMDERTTVQAIRKGLIMEMPLLMLGSFALVLKFMPIPAYQTFLSTFLGGFLPHVFTWVNQATFGILSVFLVISISLCYARLKTQQPAYVFGAIATSFSSYMVFNGLLSGTFDVASLGVSGMFTAIFSAVLCSMSFCKLALSGTMSRKLYTLGADTEYNLAVAAATPILIVLLSAITFNQLITSVFSVSNLADLFRYAANQLFRLVQNEMLRTLLFVVMLNVFWFFGLHGANVLETVSQNLFDANLLANTAAVAAGQAPPHIFTKTFLDAFVLMGGCGAALSLLIAILLFSRQQNIRSLGKMSALPMLFNINESMVFGLPIAFNGAFFIPFILTPIVSFFIAWFAVSVGLVPVPATDVQWTTPVGIGGYVATGSFAGVVLQLVNLTVGVLIYRFFLVRYERKNAERVQRDMQALVDTVKICENTGAPMALIELTNNAGTMAKMLAEDLRHVLKRQDGLMLYYQPQYGYGGACVGAEALLRWNHPRCGMIYPPLIVEIARETGLLGELERKIFRMADRDIRHMHEAGMLPKIVSVNITAVTLQDPSFFSMLTELMQNNPQLKGRLCIELTEQMSFFLGEKSDEQLKCMRDMGVHFAVDDFSMGHASLKYLQSSHFSAVKLDGSLIRDCDSNQRSKEIISSIVKMSESLHFYTVAEYVETAQQREVLHNLGCDVYQGWLYSPAVPVEDLIARLKREANITISA